MGAVRELPAAYEEHFSIDLQKDKKLSLLVNGLALLIGAALIIPMNFAVPMASLFDISQGLLPYTLRFAALLVGMVLYIILHEVVHGITMKCYGCAKVKYGFTGLYAFAGCDEYFYKLPYLVIALAPVVVWGVVLAVAGLLVPTSWFWVVYWIQVMNLSGAAGDLYVCLRFAKLPPNTLVKDVGVSMTVYTKE